MKKQPLLLICLMMLVSSACKKNPSSPAGNKDKCFITRYDNKHISNTHYYIYEYTPGNNVSKMSRFSGGGLPGSYKNIGYSSAFVAGTKSISGNLHLSTTYSYSASAKYPFKADQTIEDFSTGVNISSVWGRFDFQYDYKNRLIKVEQTTPAIGDWEYTLEIFYNDKDNVTAMTSEWTTGPRGPKSVITVSAYDDKPNPYSSIPQWKFISDAGWSFYEPEAMLTALSKNNPLDYTLGTFKRKMEYTYNEKGYPVKRINTNTNLSGQFKFEETFTYQCN